MENECSQERHIDATEKRRQEARKKGLIPRSHILSLLIGFLLILGGFYLFFPSLYEGFVYWLHESAKPQDIDEIDWMNLFQGAAISVAGLLLPWMIWQILGTCLGQGLLGGWTFAWPKARRGGKRLFFSAWVSGLKTIFYVLVFLSWSAWLAKTVCLSLLAWEPLDAEMGLMTAKYTFLFSGMIFCIPLIFCALFDVTHQRRQYRNHLKMSPQEFKEELKELEGRPEIKQRRKVLRWIERSRIS